MLATYIVPHCTVYQGTSNTPTSFWVNRSTMIGLITSLDSFYIKRVSESVKCYPHYMCLHQGYTNSVMWLAVYIAKLYIHHYVDTSKECVCHNCLLSVYHSYIGMYSTCLKNILTPFSVMLFTMLLSHFCNVTI